MSRPNDEWFTTHVSFFYRSFFGRQETEGFTIGLYSVCGVVRLLLEFRSQDKKR